MQANKQFKVASVSENTNSFGLYGMILVAQDGEAWQVGANSINKKAKGEVISVNTVQGEPQWHGFGFEIPDRWSNAPQGVIDEIWET